MKTAQAGSVAAVAVSLSLAACSHDAAPGDAPVVDFPDTKGYAEGDPGTFYSSGVQYGGFSFRTPAGQQCMTNSYPDVERTMVQCWGPRPDKGAGLWVVSAETTSPAKIRQLPAGDDQPRAEVAVLPTEHALTSEESHLVCAVDAKATVACRVGGHGFVLATNKTTLF